MLVRRDMEPELKRAATEYPVVTVTGPRQSGKTVLVKMAFPDKPYRSLEDPDSLALAESDPRGFLREIPDGAILDEIQRQPQLLSYIQGIVDERGEAGMFILTGSHQLDLHAAVAQSLAGRTALLRLLPFTIAEAMQLGGPRELDDLLLAGLYPRIHDRKLRPTRAYGAYLQTYVERDLRQLTAIRDLAVFRRFLRLCAGRVGTTLNISSLANDTGISTPTVRAWLSVLDASYVIFLLEPYFENFGKRIIKAPKIYFHDVGIATYLLGIENANQVSRDPLRGGLFENLVVSELLKRRFNAGLESNINYFRDRRGNEVDIIWREANDLIPIEVKSGQTFHRQFLKGIRFFEALAPGRVPRSYLVYAGTREQTLGTTRLINYEHLQSITGE